MTSTNDVAVKEIAPTSQPRTFSDDHLASLNSVGDLVKLSAELGVEAVDIADFGTGLTVLGTKEKGQLEGKLFYILDWRFNTGDQGEFVSLTIMLQNGEKYILNDGSTGIYADMVKLAKKFGDARPVVKVNRGLTRSDYKYKDLNDLDADGKPKLKDATTFYLNFGR